MAKHVAAQTKAIRIKTLLLLHGFIADDPAGDLFKNLAVTRKLLLHLQSNLMLGLVVNFGVSPWWLGWTTQVFAVL